MTVLHMTNMVSRALNGIQAKGQLLLGAVKNKISLTLDFSQDMR